MAMFGVGVIGGSRASARLANKLGRGRLVALGLLLAAVADFLVTFAPRQLALTAVALLLLGVGFMLAHSSLFTTATQFAHKARGTAMSLIAFSFMVGGSLGTLLGGRVIGATSYYTFYLVFAVALVVLSAIALAAVPHQWVAPEIAAASLSLGPKA